MEPQITKEGEKLANRIGFQDDFVLSGIYPQGLGPGDLGDRCFDQRFHPELAGVPGDEAGIARAVFILNDQMKKQVRVFLVSLHAEGVYYGHLHLPVGKSAGRAASTLFYQGHDFPDDLSSYKLVIHCGACMTNRRAILDRVAKCRDAGVPITNYGLTIAYVLGIFERALEPFPAALEAYRGRVNRR